MKRWGFTAVLALLMAPATVFPQMFRIQGGAGTVGGSQGGALSIYQPSATTAVGFGISDGLHIGFSRTVQLGASTVVAGDSRLTLRLPTDFAGDGRGLLLRGLTFNTERQEPGKPGVGVSAFAGWTGNGYSNAFQSAVNPTNPIQILTGHYALSRSFDFSAVTVHGTRSSVLTSALWTMTPHAEAAATIGFTGGVPVLRLRTRSSGDTWKGEISYTSGAVRLQPEPELLTGTVERVGWNATMSKRFGSWLALDGGRQEYNTADAIDAPSFGVLAGRSAMYEGGVTVRHRSLEGGIRLLQSVSGTQTSGGEVLLAGWHNRIVDVRSTGIRSRNMDGSISTSASIDTSERFSSRLRLTEGTTFANGAPTFDFGGSYDSRWGSVSVDHRETFIPFGTEAGFHRVLSLSVRLHVGSTEVGGNQVIGHGLPLLVNLSGDSFLGSDLGSMASPQSHMSSLPKYSIEGTVENAAGEVVRGAAVKVGQQVVYTDSEGRFLLRFSQASPVVLDVDPAQFLTAESYKRVGEALTVSPGKDGEASKPLVLRVERCPACGADAGDGVAAEASAQQAPEGFGPGAQKSRVQRGADEATRLARMMFRVRG
jgi:hypothetical protein